MVGEMSIRGNVLAGKWPAGEVSGWGIVRSEKSPSGKCPSGKCLNYKDKDAVLNLYSLKQLWKDNVYVIENYSECTAEIRKYLFEQAKEI